MVQRYCMGQVVPNESCIYSWGQWWIRYSKFWKVWRGMLYIFMFKDVGELLLLLLTSIMLLSFFWRVGGQPNSTFLKIRPMEKGWFLLLKFCMWLIYKRCCNCCIVNCNRHDFYYVVSTSSPFLILWSLTNMLGNYWGYLLEAKASVICFCVCVCVCVCFLSLISLYLVICLLCICIHVFWWNSKTFNMPCNK